MPGTLTATLPVAARLGHPSLSLVVLAGPVGSPCERPVPVGSTSFVLGRETAADGAETLLLPDGRVSRAHASLGPDPDHPGWVVLRDLDSKNGTFVDGRRASCAYLAGGEVLRLGETLLLVQADDVSSADTSADGSPLVGPSGALARLRREIASAAGSPLPALILGETGVGKELVARELHAKSGLSGPFRAVNCAAIPRELAESTLFGHRRGAYTGAVQASEGLIRATAGGTLLLDEVGELDPALQAKLLRAVEEGAVSPVGEVEPVAVDVRFVAATNRDLYAAADSGAFRSDLLARLAGVVLRVPPLRERRADVIALLAHFAGLDRRELLARFEADALEALVLYDWPRNVRELELFARRVRDHVAPVTCAELDEPARAALEAARAAPRLDATFAARGACPSRAELEQALAACAGNLAEVGRRFGRDRRQVYRWLVRYGLPRD